MRVNRRYYPTNCRHNQKQQQRFSLIRICTTIISIVEIMIPMKIASFFGGSCSWRCGSAIRLGVVKAFVATTTTPLSTRTTVECKRRRCINPTYSLSQKTSNTHRNLSSISNNSYGSNTNKKKKKNSNDIIYTKNNMRNIISSKESLTAKKVHTLLKQRKRREQLKEVVVEGPRIIFDMYRNVHTRQYLNRILIDVDLFEQYALYFQQLHDQFPSIAFPNDSSSHENDESTTNIDSASSEKGNDEESVTAQQPSDATADNGDKINRPRTIVFHPTYGDVFKACCTDTVTHQGIVAICDMPQHSRSSIRTLKKKDVLNQNQYHEMYLVCDAIQDPGNMGTLIRSAAACGVTAIYVLPNACDVWNPKAIRSAMGATFTIPIIETQHWDDCYKELLKIGCTSSTIYAATMLDGDDNDGSSKNPSPTFNIENEMKNLSSSNAKSIPSLTKSTAHYDVDWIGASLSLTKSTAHYDVDWIGASLLRPQEDADASISTTDATDTGEATVTTKLKRRRRIPTASALIIGSEGNGLTGNIRSAIEKEQIQTVYVPMMAMSTTTTTSNQNESRLDSMNNNIIQQTPIVESLNAAICGSIILFEYLRQKNTHARTIISTTGNTAAGDNEKK